MPSMNCPVCKKLTPIKYNAREGRWYYWPHGPEDRRCPGGEKPVSSRGRV